MSEETDQPAIKSQIRGQTLDQVISLLVIATVIGSIMVGYVEYFQERRIADEIQALGGVAKPHNMAQGLPEFWPYDRIYSVCLVMAHVSPKTASDLGSLKSLQFLSLTATNVTDADLEQLRHLSNLKALYLNDTRITVSGRARLRQSLPQCAIYPDP